MRLSSTRRWGMIGVALGIALGVIPPAASAASPKAGGLYTGMVAKTVYHDFTAPVSFTISRNGRQLRGFTWAGAGCTGLGGPGNAWASRFLNYRVGTINVARGGTFAVKNVKTTNTQGHLVKVTTSSVAGRFRTATTATGTISFTQKMTKTCHGRVTFTATLGPSPGALHKLTPGNRSILKATSAKLGWNISRNATDYHYCLDTSNNDACNGQWVAAYRSTRATVGGLKAGTTYYWQVKASSVHGTVAADNGSWYAFTTPKAAAKPRAGSWRSTAITGGSTGGLQVTNISFTVAPDQARILGFRFDWSYSMPGKPPTYACSGSTSSSESVPSPIAGAEFSTPSETGPWGGNAAGSGTFDGVFDSATSAHGSARFSAFISGPGCYFSQTVSTGTFTWTAGPQP